ncbi:glycosyl transferase [Pseudoxanthomonas wuyuanensis]|nr:glycosyl transferase [Pseudoxanthomonas wuyuanensis]
MMCMKEQARLLRESKLFDGRWYLRSYADVGVLGIDPAEHYVRFGAATLRNPSPNFDTAHYMERNPDVAATGMNPLVHYLLHGAVERRSVRPVTADSPLVTDEYDDAGRWLFDIEPLLQGAKLEGTAVVVARRKILREPPPPGALVVAWVINQHDKMTHQYRVRNYAEALSALNVHPLILSERDLAEGDFGGIDIVVLCRIAANPAMLRTVDEFRSGGGKVIFDIDDMVFDPDRIDFIRHVAAKSEPDKDIFRKIMSRLRDTMWRSDLVTTSTFALKLEVERMGMRALVLPNNISLRHEAEAQDLMARSRDEGARIRIGYFSGTKSHEHDFAECSEALVSIMQEQPNVELLVVGWLEAAERFRTFGDRFIQMPLLSHHEMMKALSTVDINLAPLELRNPFTHCKSELKIFEAALYGIPTIASPTASYSAVITHQRDGLLAETRVQWVKLLRQLISEPKRRVEIGQRAKKNIANRFLVSTTVHEANAILRSVKNERARPLPPRSIPPMDRTTPAISVVSILYRKSEEVVYFLETMRRQSFDLPYEIVLVNDRSPDESVAVVEEFVRKRSSLPDANPNMQVRIITNDANLGNCASRNRGVSESTGDIIVVVDADCLFNRDFLALHYRAHQRGKCDAVVGPKGIETNHRPPMSVLALHEADSSLAVQEARPQDGTNQDSFVNSVTRNFSVRRSFAEASLPEGLFDEQFTYSASPDSGFGWEDVEMGCRLYKAHARIKFLADTASIHISHPPTVENRDKPYRSLKNFRRLHEKHPLLRLESRQWTRSTYEAIVKWCKSAGGDLKSNADFHFMEEHLADTKRDLVVFTRPAKPLRILTFRWHCPHQYELYRLGHQFTLATGMGTGLCERWEWAHRPMPTNARMVPYARINPHDYDLAILHFDENLLHPEICHGKVPLDWGATFLKAMKEWDLPKVAICHGTPQFHGQYDPEYDQSDLGEVIEENRLELVELLKDVEVVCNSHQSMREWKFIKSRTIWHGFSPHEFPPGMKGAGVYAMAIRGLANRPHYNGYQVMRRVMEALGRDIRVSNLAVGDPSVQYTPRTYEWAKVKYENYVRSIGAKGIYLNTTVRSPMPRTRGEAMMAGVPTVSLRNHDVDMFIENGVNGFFTDTPEELADQVRYLFTHQEVRERMGKASRLTAMNVFNQDRYLAAWTQLIRDIM